MFSDVWEAFSSGAFYKELRDALEMTDYDMYNFRDTFALLCILVALLLGLVAVITLICIKNSCPVCKGWNSMSKMSHDLIGTKAVTMKKTESDTITIRDNTGSIVQSGTIDRTVHVPGVESTYEMKYRCDQCGHVSAKYNTSTREA